LWISAAQYEYDWNANVAGARNLLLRAIRLNPERREVWWEYAKLECLYILKIVERRRILGLDNLPKEDVMDDTGFEGDEITLPSIAQGDLSKTDPGQEKDLLLSPLTNVATNPALNGAIIMAIYSSATESRPDDVSLMAGFYDIFERFYARLSFIISILETIKTDLENKFPGRGKTVFVQIRDHARGIDPRDVKFPSALRDMMKTANAIPSLLEKERKICVTDLLRYLESISDIEGLDENVQKVISIFMGRVSKWKDISA
jgi:U3 small nucleolar RNA-associated protein 6